MKSFGQLLNVDKYKEKKKKSVFVDEKTLFHIFNEIVKEEFGNKGITHVKPVFFKNKVLYLKFGNSVWASEIWNSKSFLLMKLEKKVGSRLVVDIKVGN